jgi:signal transduction histidine kinase
VSLIERSNPASSLVCSLQLPRAPVRARLICAPLLDFHADVSLVTLTFLDHPDESTRPQDARDSLLKSIIDHLPLTVFAVDCDGMIIFDDSRQTSMEGLLKDTVGKSVYEIRAGEEQFLDDTRRVLTGETVERERTYNGHVYETYYAPLYDLAGAIIGAVGIGTDITERLRMQQSAIDSDRLRLSLQKEVELSEMKSKIMRRIAHEFRTPLSTIQLSAQMLERYSDRLSSDERATRVEHILRQTRHITRLLEDIALVVKSQSQRAQINRYDFDLSELIRTLVDEIRTNGAAQHFWAVSVAPDVEHVYADSRLVGIMLQNLLSNASMYSDPGTEIKLQAYREEQSLVMTVSDQGIGILPDEISHVFEVFYRGSNFDERPGLGLGLSLVHDAVEHHKGTIQIDSTPNVGTTVTIRIPL